MKNLKEEQKHTTEAVKKLLEFVVFIGNKIGRDRAFRLLEEYRTDKRIKWLRKNRNSLNLSGSEVEKGLQLICLKLNIDPQDLEIIKKTDTKILYRPRNFCPILEACKVLDLDTREVCKKAYEGSQTKFLKAYNPKLTFKRNYSKIRPYSNFCEETIEIKE